MCFNGAFHCPLNLGFSKFVYRSSFALVIGALIVLHMMTDVAAMVIFSMKVKVLSRNLLKGGWFVYHFFFWKQEMSKKLPLKELNQRNK